jgi:hypothetical protein
MSATIPRYVAPVVLALVVVLAYWLVRLLSRGADAADLDPRTHGRVRMGTGIFIGGWLLLALLTAGSAPTVDAAGNGRVPLGFPLFLSGSLVVGVGLLASRAWRRVLDSIPSESLISVQIYRVVGVIFLLLYTSGALPGYFALPAGWGDVAVGLAAPVVALAVRNRIRGSRSLAVAWNLVGLFDLVTAVGLGTGYLLAAMDPGVRAGTVAGMTFFPLILIPTFIVPVSIILHIYSIRITLQTRAATSASGNRSAPARSRPPLARRPGS